MRSRAGSPFLLAMLVAIVASCREPAKPELGPPPEVARVDIETFHGRMSRHLVPGEWIHTFDCPYQGGTNLTFEREGCRVFLRVDGRARRLVSVDLGWKAESKREGLNALQQAIAKGVSPLTIACEGKDLATLPPVPVNIEVALLVREGPFDALAGAIARCPGMYAASLQGDTPPSALRALRAAKNLISLSISGRLTGESGSSFDDVAALTEMRNLRALSLANCAGKINLRVLSGLTQLRSLHMGPCLEYEQLNLEPLRGLTELRELGLYGRSYWMDLEPLAGMTSLVSLDLEVGPDLADIEPLGNLTNLAELTLELWPNTKLKSLSPLGRLTKLQHLRLLRPEKPDLGFLSQLKELKELELYCHNDLTGFPQHAELGKLTSLRIRWCEGLSDLTPLGELHALEELTFGDCERMADLAPLAKLGCLRRLEFDRCKHLGDLAPLGALANLNRLLLHESPLVTNLTPLASLKSLKDLFIQRLPGVSDLRPLASLPSLEALGLDAGPKVTDLTPLVGIRPLKQLYLGGCRNVNDLSPLRALLERGVEIDVHEEQRPLWDNFLELKAKWGF